MSLALFSTSDASAVRACAGRGCAVPGVAWVRTREAGSLWCCEHHRKVLEDAGEVVDHAPPPRSRSDLLADRPMPLRTVCRTADPPHPGPTAIGPGEEPPRGAVGGRLDAPEPRDAGGGEGPAAGVAAADPPGGGEPGLGAPEAGAAPVGAGGGTPPPPTAPLSPEAPMTAATPARICKMPGCDRRPSGHGWCGSHYSHAIRRGFSPAKVTPEELQAAIDARRAAPEAAAPPSSLASSPAMALTEEALEARYRQLQEARVLRAMAERLIPGGARLVLADGEVVVDLDDLFLVREVLVRAADRLRGQALA